MFWGLGTDVEMQKQKYNENTDQHACCIFDIVNEPLALTLANLLVQINTHWSHRLLIKNKALQSVPLRITRTDLGKAGQP